MDLIDLLLCPEVVAGIVCGIAAAALVHWLAAPAEPVLLEALLVAAGFAGGVLWGHKPGASDE